MERPEIDSTDDIEVTPEMIAAGVVALVSCDARFEGPEEVVRDVWAAMQKAAMKQTPPT